MNWSSGRPHAHMVSYTVQCRSKNKQPPAKPWPQPQGIIKTLILRLEALSTFAYESCLSAETIPRKGVEILRSQRPSFGGSLPCIASPPHSSVPIGIAYASPAPPGSWRRTAATEPKADADPKCCPFASTNGCPGTEVTLG